jgi:glycosyltransferase involved in cell wall biosynthesis
VLTKCGGPNPKFYYPKSKNLITYSEENFRYFKSKKKYKKSNIYLIPNRVTYSKQDEERIGELNSTYRLGGYDYVFLRIARIGNAYKKTIKQLLNLHEKLAKDFRCCTLIIGSIEDETVYKDLKKNQQEHVHFITENKYTIKANELIDVADVVLGTGRSFMEAAIQKKLMLATIANSDYPILVNEDNFKQLSGFNFSPRAIINDSNEQKTLSAIQNVLSAKNQYKEFVQLNIKMFNSSFKVDEVVGKYIDIYKNIEFKYRVNLLDTIKNVLFLVRVYNQNKKAAK